MESVEGQRMTVVFAFFFLSLTHACVAGSRQHCFSSHSFKYSQSSGGRRNRDRNMDLWRIKHSFSVMTM